MVRESSYRDLVAWQKAMTLVEAVYRETASWPGDERFGLTAQVRRAVVSVPANIAEGSGRSGSSELRRFLSIAHGSLCEVQTQLEIAERLGFMEQGKAQNLLEHGAEVSRILRGLIRSLETARPQRPTHDSRLTTHD
jgi:four helix bundle protein